MIGEKIDSVRSDGGRGLRGSVTTDHHGEMPNTSNNGTVTHRDEDEHKEVGSIRYLTTMTIVSGSIGSVV